MRTVYEATQTEYKYSDSLTTIRGLRKCQEECISPELFEESK